MIRGTCSGGDVVRRLIRALLHHLLHRWPIFRRRGGGPGAAEPTQHGLEPPLRRPGRLDVAEVGEVLRRDGAHREVVVRIVEDRLVILGVLAAHVRTSANADGRQAGERVHCVAAHPQQHPASRPSEQNDKSCRKDCSRGARRASRTDARKMLVI